MEYLGGTYISQIEATSKENARVIWIKTLNIEEIEGFTIADKENIIKENFSDDDITPINQTKSVWFFMVEAKNGYGHVNMVKTKL
ncbi:hypothetical protein J7I42_23945 [Niastella sp. MAH-29]|uniref:Uncharacterized protein n=2 Tax=Chitinophagaceae TaxID=563835 RepID=A0ABS3YZP2_9BACT|nr:hypothetical protein [Niastella soli]